jgi:hypothetical protein
MAPQISPVQQPKPVRVSPSEISRPQELVEHFKDRGHFDHLRRDIMADFNASVSLVAFCFASLPTQRAG